MRERSGDTSSTDPSALATALADRYRVERELGRGGMATVYLAHDLKHDRPVAIKVLHPELGAVLGAERFLSEIRTTANLQHPNILPLFDSGAAGGLVFYVMPFVAGETLRDRLRREGQLGIAETVRLAQGVAQALDYAHRHGVIHRDIKPENILLQDGQALVADFGVALAVSNAGGARITQTGISVGTPQYMSPEQAAAERQTDGRSDQYSLAAVVYEMLAGEPPFTGPSAPAILTKLMTEPVAPLETRRASVPGGLAAAVHQALQKVPADRFATAAEFGAALGAADGPDARGWTARARSRRSMTVLQGSLFAAGLLASGWALAWLTGARKGSPSAATRLSVTVPAGSFIGTNEVPTLAIARDGSRLAYSTTSGIVIRDLDSFEHRLAAVPDGGWNPTFSPDGRWVAFLTKGGVWRLPAVGGAPVRINEDWAYHATWGDDGNIYFNSAAGATGIMVMTPEGTDRRRLTSLDSARGEAFHMSPEYLPGGILLYSAVGPTGGWAQSTLMAIDLDEPERPWVVLEGASSARFVAPRHLAYLDANGQVMVREFDARAARVAGEPMLIDSVRSTNFGAIAHVAASRTGMIGYLAGSERHKHLLVERDASGATQRVLHRGHLGWISLSPDGRTLAFNDWSGRDTHGWVLDLVNPLPRQLTTASTENEGTIWSPDGERFLYSRQALGGWREVLEHVVGSGRPDSVLFRRPAHLHVHGWSPDARWVVYSQFENQRSNLYMVDLTAPDSSILLAENSGSAELRSDGRELAYCTSEAAGDRIYVADFPTLRRRHRVAERDACWPRFSRDGRSLYFTESFADHVTGLFEIRRPTADGVGWSAPRLLFRGLSGPFALRENPLRFLKVEEDSATLAREIRIITGWGVR